MIYKRNCPSCNGEVSHKTENALYQAIISNRPCRSCSQMGKVVSLESKQKMSRSKIGKPTWSSLHKTEFGKMVNGENHPMYGKHHSDDMKRKQSERYKGRRLSKETRKKLKQSNKLAWKDPNKRKKYHDSLLISKWLNVRCDVGQLEMLEKWNRLGFKFEPNYPVKTSDDLFYVDGYDTERNVVLEYDSEYHNKHNQSQLDRVREGKIIETLKPKRFWRFNSKKNLFIECTTKTASRP